MGREGSMDFEGPAIWGVRVIKAEGAGVIHCNSYC